MKKVKVLIFLSTGVLAGFEKMMYYLANNINKDNFDVTIGILYGDGIIAQRLVDEKHKVVFFRHDKKGIISVVLNFIKLLRVEKFSVLYLGGYKVNLIGRIIGKLFGCKIITAQRSIDDHRTRLQNFVDNITSCLVDMYISNTKAAEQMLILKKKINRNKILTIYNGIDISLHNKKDEVLRLDEFGIAQGTYVICTVANFFPYKGHEYLFECVNEIRKTIDRFCLLLVGDGDYRGVLEKKAVDLGIQDIVFFLGIRKDIPNILNVTDVFVLPSLFEGMPNAIMEAMASKKAVVATNVGGVPELVADCVTGYLVPPKQPLIMAEKIIELLSNPEKMMCMGENGYDRVVNMFSIPKMVEHTEEAFIKVVNNNLKNGYWHEKR